MEDLDFFELLNEFTSRPGIWLYPALVPDPKGYIDRIMADNRVTLGEIFTELFPPDQPPAPAPASALQITQEGMLEQTIMGIKQGGIRWDEPLSVQICCWPYEDGSGTEVSLSVRQRGAPHSEPWLHLRTLWPADAIRADLLNKKQVYAPYLKPAEAQRLWALLSAAAALHGERPLNPFARQPEDAELQELRSQGPRAECVACKSTAVVFVAPQAYQCHECGHEGGEGYEAHRARLSRQQYSKMPLTVRRQLVLTDLVNAYGDIVSASKLSDWRGVSSNRPRSFEAERITLYRFKTFEAIRAALNKTPEYSRELQELLDFEPRCTGTNRAKELAEMIQRVYDQISAAQRPIVTPENQAT